MDLDSWEMARQLWDFIVLGLNEFIPIMMPDGTKIGAVVFFIILGGIIAIFSGKKLSDWGRSFWRDLTN